jgi:nitrogen fixation protein NifU and related proteins
MPASPESTASAAAPDPSVSSLYQEIILSHYRAPKHRGTIAAASAGTEHRNPLCGDVITVQIVVDGDRIADAAFSASACSITQASASMLLEKIIGGTVADAWIVLSTVERLINSTTALTDSELGELGDLRSLASVARFPARKACVRLVTGAITGAIAAS